MVVAANESRKQSFFFRKVRKMSRENFIRCTMEELSLGDIVRINYRRQGSKGSEFTGQKGSFRWVEGTLVPPRGESYGLFCVNNDRGLPYPMAVNLDDTSKVASDNHGLCIFKLEQ